MKKDKINFSLKDQLFNREKVEYLAGLLKGAQRDFLGEEFVEEVMHKFPELELKERIYHITDMLYKYLPDDFNESVDILVKSLPELEENGTLDNNFGDFIFAPYSHYISQRGIVECRDVLPKHLYRKLDFCFNALEKITVCFSAEDAIRYFLNSYEEQTFEKMLEWSQSGNYHVRRLSSEGSRPKLPWCQKINLDYRKGIQILDNLYGDESRFVTRSVANHLNDIAKINPDLVVETLKKWSGPQSSPLKGEGVAQDLDYIISHSTRTLVKQGDVRTLEFLGFKRDPQLEVGNIKLEKDSIKVGEALKFSLSLHSKKQQKLIIDYKIYFPNKKGVLVPKVFKIKKGEFSGEISIEKRHPLKFMTTKALYEGKHELEIIVNGKSFGKKSFELIF